MAGLWTWEEEWERSGSGVWRIFAAADQEVLSASSKGCGIGMGLATTGVQGHGVKLMYSEESVAAINERIIVIQLYSGCS